MKSVARIILILLLGLTTNAKAQLFTLTEHDWKGNDVTLKSPYIVDLNSTVVIDIDHEKVTEQLKRVATGSPLTKELINNITKFKPVLDSGNQAIVLLEKASAKMDPNWEHYLDSFNAVYLASAQAYNMLYPLIAFNGNELYEKIESSNFGTGNRPLEDMKIIFNALDEYLQGLQKQLDDVLVREGVKIQMAATLNGAKGRTTELPLPGYNNAPTPAFYDPYAFALALDDKQLKQLEAMKTMADNINNKGFKDAFKEYGNQVKNVLQGNLKKELAKILNDVTTDPNLQPVVKDLSADTKAVRDDITALVKKCTVLASKIDGLANKYSNGLQVDGAAAQQQVLADISSVIQDVTDIKTQIEKLQADLPAAIAATTGTIKNNLTGIQTYATGILTEVGDIILKSAGIPLNIQDLLSIGSSINSISLFTDNAISHTLSGMPLQTRVNLKQAGQRQHGDEVTLEIQAIRRNGPPVSLGSQDITLFKKQASVELQATLGFINQVVEKTNAQGNGTGKYGPESLFHAAPSTSIIFKFPTPTCTNVNYRRFIDFGMGFNIATFNFNPKTVTELGVGMVFSCFNVHENWKNVVQGGFGYNLVGNKFYGMIGVNFPFLNYSADLK